MANWITRRTGSQAGEPCGPSKPATAKSKPPPNKVIQADHSTAGWEWLISAPGVANPCEKKTLPITANAAAASRWRGGACNPRDATSRIEITAAENVVKVTI